MAEIESATAQSKDHQAVETQREDDSRGRRPSGVPETDARVQLATERTLLAWMRTGLALMAFGFVVARFSLIMQSLGVTTSQFFTIKATILGVVLIVLGVIANIGAPMHYRKYFLRIDRRDVVQFTAWSLTMFVAYALAFIGIALAIYLLLVDASSLNLNFMRPPR